MTKRYRVEITEAALADLTAIAEWICAEAGSATAQQMVDSVLERIGTLETFPNRGAPVPELEALGWSGFRTLPVPPYRFLYRIRGDRVTIQVVYRERRDFVGLLEERLLRNLRDLDGPAQ